MADAHAGGAIGKQGGGEEITFGIARHQAATGDQSSAFVLGNVDVAKVLVELSTGHDRPDIDPRLQSMADLDRAHAFGHGFDELVVNAGGDNQAA